MSKDDTGNGTAAAAARAAKWTRPMIAKTGTTEEYKSAAFIGATPDFAGAVQTFNDGTNPRPICIGAAPRLCGNGNIFGGTIPAKTWFETMTKVHGSMPASALPQVEQRYLKGGREIQVPDVVGKQINDATRILDQAGYKVSQQTVNSEQPKGTVVSQSPRGNALRGTVITLSVSSGYVPPPVASEPPAQPPPSPGNPNEPPPITLPTEPEPR
jgi:membrane peptidoglycan carboxypeptidase